MCPGEQLVLECDTNSSVLLLEWSITFNSSILQHTEMRSVDSLGSAESQPPFVVNHTEFQFLRNSVSPLISTMIIHNVSTILNGTRIDCRYNGMTSTTFIRVIKNGTGTITDLNTVSFNNQSLSLCADITVQIHPLVIESESFLPDTIAIIVHWEKQDNVLYISTISPSAEVTVRFITSTRIQVTVAYNTPYNLSIVGTLCGQNTTEVIELHYGEWFHPYKSTGYDVSSLIIVQSGVITLAIFWLMSISQS